MRRLFTTLPVVALAIPLAWFAVAHAGLAARQSSGWSLILDRPFPGKYEDMAFPDSTHGWLVSAGGDILHTDDGGATWTQQASRKGSLRSIDFIDAKRGF